MTQVVDRLNELQDAIIYAADSFENEKEFKNRTKEMSDKIPFIQAQYLQQYFHAEITTPEELKPRLLKYRILEVWMDVCQNSIFEILYNYKSESIELLNKVGFGVYDLTQTKAIAVLCTIVNEDIKKIEIVKSICQNIKSFRYEALIPSVSSVSSIPKNQNVIDTCRYFYREFRDTCNIWDAY